MLSANFRSKQLFIGVLACSFTIAIPTFPTLNLEIGQRVDAQILQKSLSAINWRNLAKIAKIIIRKPPKPVTVPTRKPTLPSTPTIPKPIVKKTTSTPQNPTPTSTGKPPKPTRRNGSRSKNNPDPQYLGTMCRGNDKVYIFTTSSEWLYFKNSEFVKIDNPSFNLLCDIDVIQLSSNKFDFPCKSTSYTYYKEQRLFYESPILVPGVGCTNS